MDKIFLELLNLSIAASWLVLAVLILRVLLKKAPKAIVCALWLIVGLRLMLPFSIESVLSLIPSREIVSPEIVYAAQPMINSGIEIVDRAVNPILSESFAPDPAVSVNPLQVLSYIGGCVWLMGFALMLGYGIVSYLRLRLKVREAVLVEKDVRRGPSVGSPFVLGFFRPCIYLPSALAAEDVPMVLAHERAHLRRRDHWIKPLGFLLLSVYWFNPLLWLSYALLCRDIEMACDERVMKDLGSGAKKEYSMALLNCSAPHRAVAACPLAFGELGVKARIKSVLNYRKPSFWITVAALLVCALVAVCFLTDPVNPEDTPPDPAGQLIDPAAEPVSEGLEESPEQPDTVQAEQPAAPKDEFVFLIPAAGEGEDYAPAALAEVENRTVDARIVESLTQMLADCRAAGHTVTVFRAYESYEDSLRKLEAGDAAYMTQEEYWDWLRSETKLELQTGLSVLLARYENGNDYATSPITNEAQFQAELDAWDETFAWLKDNAPDYGFVWRWPPHANQTHSGHSMFRYVGEDMAHYLTENGLCLEEYLMLPRA